tara:strand:+ start:1047 stop:1379 length:333 start_codon:yes stop_codon:yes gene_type:complete
MKRIKRASEGDYMSFCIECDNALHTVGSFLIHPDMGCSEEDGVKVLVQYKNKFEEFQAKYTLPEGDVKELVARYNQLVDLYDETFCRRISKWFTSLKEKAIHLKTRCIKN